MVTIIIKVTVWICLVSVFLLLGNTNIFAAGDDPPATCVTSFSLNIFATGVEFLVCHLNGIFDEYIAQTPNLLVQNSKVANAFENELEIPLREIALRLLILMLIVSVGYLLIRMLVLVDREEHLYKILGIFFLNYLLILILPAMFSLWIDLNNAICETILSAFGGTSLSSLIASQIHISDGSFFPSIINTTLWVLLLLALLYIVFFFILRFFLIWIFFLVIPLFIAIGMLPFAKGMLEAIIVKTLQFTLVQPIFLIGVGEFLIITKYEQDIITRYILGIGSLMTLAVIPPIFAGIAGGKVLSTANHYVENAYEELTHRVSSGLHFIDEKLSEQYEPPIEKLDK